MDATRRTLLTTGAAAAAVAAAPLAFAQQQTGKGEAAMPFYQKDTKDKIPPALRQVRTFLRAHRP